MEEEFDFISKDDYKDSLYEKAFPKQLVECEKQEINLKYHVNIIINGLNSTDIADFIDILEKFRLDLDNDAHYLPIDYREYEVSQNLLDLLVSTDNNGLSKQIIRVITQWTYKQNTDQDIFSNLEFFDLLLKFLELSYETIDPIVIDDVNMCSNYIFRTDIIYLFNNIIIDSEIGLKEFIDGQYLSKLYSLIINNSDDDPFRISFVQLCEQVRQETSGSVVDFFLEAGFKLVIDHIFYKLYNSKIGYYETTLIINIITSNNVFLYKETISQFSHLVCNHIGIESDFLVIEAILKFCKKQMLIKLETNQNGKIIHNDQNQINDEAFLTLLNNMNYAGLFEITRFLIDNNEYSEEFKRRLITLILDVISLIFEYRLDDIIWYIYNSPYEVANLLFEHGSYQIKTSLLNLFQHLVKIELHCKKILEIRFLKYFEQVLSEFDSPDLIERFFDIICSIFNHSMYDPMIKALLMENIEETEFYDQLDHFYYQDFPKEVISKFDILYAFKAELYNDENEEEVSLDFLDSQIPNSNPEFSIIEEKETHEEENNEYSSDDNFSEFQEYDMDQYNTDIEENSYVIGWDFD